MHIKRHPEEQVGFIGVRDSESFQRFGAQQMSTPGSKSKLDKRFFIDLKPEEVLERKRHVGAVGTLPGIKSKYEYICKPDGQVCNKNYAITMNDATNFLFPGQLEMAFLLLRFMQRFEMGGLRG